MHNKSIERIVNLWIRLLIVMAIAIIVVLGAVIFAAVHASPAAPKDGVCEVLVVENGQTTVTEIGPC
ncbi:hypothetical protein VPH526E571_0020 [Vibrio phage 526E57-1]